MRPLACEPTITHVVTVVGGVNNDGVIGQTLCLKGLDETPDGIVNSAHHAEVSPHIGAILGFGIPTPKETFTVDGGLKEIRLALKNLGIIQSGWCNLILLIQAINCSGPREMPDTRPTIPILGMAGIKPHVKGKGLVLGLVLKELNSAIDNQLGFMTQ